MAHLTGLIRQQAYSPEDAMGILEIDEPTAIYLAPALLALSSFRAVGYHFYYDVKDMDFGTNRAAFYCLGPGLWVHRIGNDLHNVYDNDKCPGPPAGVRRARLNNSLRCGDIWSGAGTLASFPSVNAATPPARGAVAEGSPSVPCRGARSAPEQRCGRDAQSAHDKARFVAETSALHRQERLRLRPSRVGGAHNLKSASTVLDLRRKRGCWRL